MLFRTEIIPETTEFRLTPEKPVTLLGSCFVENIGAKMRSALWDARVNPCGIQYNPMSLAAVVECALEQTPAAPYMFDYEGLWHNWLMPSAFSSPSRDEAERLFTAALQELREALTCSQALMVTFGTALLYTLRESGRVAGNCHKVPQEHFAVSMASPEEISDLWQPLIERLLALNPELKLIFTVSPVRHLRPSVRRNTLSKATLQLAVERLTEQHRGVATYFPAYELLMDDLRDYRFYGADMTHPSPAAVDYIWEKFAGCYLDEPARRLLAEGEQLRRRMDHRQLTASPSAAEFHAATERLLADFLRRHPAMKP